MIPDLVDFVRQAIVAVMSVGLSIVAIEGRICLSRMTQLGVPSSWSPPLCESMH